MKWAGSCALVEEGLELVVGENLSKVCRGVVCKEEEDYPHYDGGGYLLFVLPLFGFGKLCSVNPVQKKLVEVVDEVCGFLGSFGVGYAGEYFLVCYGVYISQDYKFFICCENPIKKFSK